MNCINSEIILLIENDRNIADPNKYAFTRAGYRVFVAQTLAQARKYLQLCPIDLIVLDTVLPDGSGYDFCREIRRNSDVPILFLAALNNQEDILYGLALGANDFVAKPYDMYELLARVEAQLKNQKKPEVSAHSNIEIEGLVLDMSSRRAFFHGKDLCFTPKEFLLIEALARHPGKYLSADDLYKNVWGMKANGDMRTLFVHISTTRTKLKKYGVHHIQIKRDRVNGIRLVWQHETNSVAAWDPLRPSVSST